MLEVAGVDRVVAVDLHRGQTQGFFSPNIPVDNLDASKIALPYLQTKFLHHPVVVSPDANGTARAKSFADKMLKVGFPASFAMVVDSKCRGENEEEQHKEYHLVGDVAGKDVIIVDDIIDTGGRMTRTAQLVRENGAERVSTVVEPLLLCYRSDNKYRSLPLPLMACLRTGDWKN